MLLCLTTAYATLAQAAPAPPSAGGGSGVTLAIAAALLVVAVVLFAVEVFVPSGGIIGLSGVFAMLVGVVLCFRVDTTWGLVSAIFALVAMPTAVAVGIKVAPDTPIFRLFSLKAVQPRVVRTTSLAGETVEEQDDDPPAGPQEGPAIGDRGEAVTSLRPSGKCVFGGRREDCFAAHGMISCGAAVEVVDRVGRIIKVRPVDD